MVAARNVQPQRDSQNANYQSEVGAIKENQQQQHGRCSSISIGSYNNSSTTQFGPGTRSATPISVSSSRPSSSTPQLQQQHYHPSHQRASSSCSTTSANINNNSNNLDSAPLGQCRICRKFILANETCHLCSACNQFVCEDCGSYSASNQVS